MGYEEIQSRAREKWEALQSSQHPRILIGTATCGRAAGALATVEAIREELQSQGLEAQVIQVGCMGLCYNEPLVAITKPDYPTICYHHITAEKAPQLINRYLINDDPCLEWALGTLEGGDGQPPFIPELPRFEHELRLLLASCGYIDPEDIDHYIALGGYGGLAEALEMEPEAIVEEIKRSGLRGLGGAGFPTGLKWELCRKAIGWPKYVVCNADEGDPGAFMDRVLLESNPHQVLEGMIIAGYAVGTPHGYIYIRAEYPLAVKRLRVAIAQAEELGFLGNNILDSGFGFHIGIVQGAGAFVCGESSALMYSIEGKRGYPRVRPPHSVESGLWGKPTLLDNVKTFGHVPLIITRGADWFASIGTEGSKGTAVFALAGSVVGTGLVEVPMGTSLRTLIFDVGGGIPDEKEFKAVQIGGPSGGCLPEELLGTPVDFDSLNSAGAIMGSGGMVVLDQGNCMVDVARFFLDFTQKESCGKCTMCRIGTKHLFLVLEDIVRGQGRMEDLDLLMELAEDIKAGSLCGLGQTAPNPLLTTLRYFRDEYEAHIRERRCPALVCRDLIAFYILPDKCDRGCEHCVLTCPSEAISGGKGEIKVVDQEKCIKCGVCMEVCPPEYDAVIKVSPPEAIPQSEG